VANVTLFSKTKELEIQTDEFCDKVAEGVLSFKLGITRYLDGDQEAFEEKKQQVSSLESRGDELRREIQRRLYLETLIPESRADVLLLLENTDHILNACESTMWQFSIEKPDISPDLAKQFASLVDAVGEAVSVLVGALRAFFHGSPTISDHMHKVIFFETEADKISHRLMRAVFDGDLELAHKNQLRHFVLHMDDIADIAEDVADNLAIFALKRAI